MWTLLFNTESSDEGMEVLSMKRVNSHKTVLTVAHLSVPVKNLQAQKVLHTICDTRAILHV